MEVSSGQNEFINANKTYFKKLAEQAVKDKKWAGWDMMQSVSDPNQFLFIHHYNSPEQYENAKNIFSLFRSEAGEELVLQKNFFVERILLADSATGYTDEEKSEYIRPFLNEGEDRRPTLTWPRQIPLDGEPAAVVEEVRKNAEFHKVSEIPKLFVNADPGSILVGDQREFARSWKNQKEVTVQGSHFIQEDSSEEIGTALRDFIQNL